MSDNADVIIRKQGKNLMSLCSRKRLDDPRDSDPGFTGRVCRCIQR